MSDVARTVDHVELRIIIPPAYIEEDGYPDSWGVPATTYWGDMEWEELGGCSLDEAIQRLTTAYGGLDSLGVGCAVDIHLTDGDVIDDALGAESAETIERGNALFRGFAKAHPKL